ncbi:MAG: malonyl CoA-acyl carrier protein transacylase, partial [Candidatus Omnitrophica bacterium]|nr:malonyl CoA-acyl carrier protein transacylase [Candidatus Omnitrophota bacterium]
LDVSGPFHSSLMTGARDKLRDFIEKVRIDRPKIPFISNVDAQVQSEPDKIKENLISQVVSRTLWEESMRLAVRSGVKTFLEIGPGQVLKGIAKKIDPKLEVKNLETSQDMRQPVTSV